MINIEQWKNILGFNNWYQVSNYGNVRSVDRIIADTHGNLKRYKGKVLRQRLQNSGYNVVDLYDINRQKCTILVHRLVALSFVHNDNPSVNVMVDHIDRNRLNNKSSNLRWVNGSLNRINSSKYTISKHHIIIRDMATNEIICEFDKIKDACKFIGRDHKVVRNILNSKTRIKYGYKWEDSSTTIENNNGIYVIDIKL